MTTSLNATNAGKAHLDSMNITSENEFATDNLAINNNVRPKKNDSQQKIVAQLKLEDLVSHINENSNNINGADLTKLILHVANQESDVGNVDSAFQQLQGSFENLIRSVGDKTQQSNAALALQGTPGNQEKTLQEMADGRELLAKFANFGAAASALREILNDTTKAIEDAIYSLVAMMTQLNALYEMLNKVAREKTEKSAVQACKAAVSAAALSIVKEAVGTGALTVKTAKHINKTEKAHKEMLDYKKQSSLVEMQGKAPKFDINGNGANNRTAAKFTASELERKADEIAKYLKAKDMTFTKSSTQYQTGKMVSDSAIKMQEAEGNKESKLTENEGKNIEFQRDVAQKTLEQFTASLRKYLQAVMDYIQQIRSSQQNLMNK